MSASSHHLARLIVERPNGGRLELQTVEEVELYETARDRYLQSFHLSEQNDLNAVSAILTQQLAMFRAEQRLNGMVPEFAPDGQPTGRYVRGPVKPQDMNAAQNTVIKAAAEIREQEKALGIDKRTREAGGTQSVMSYVETLKLAARSYGLHLSERVKEYEKVMMEARWKLRLLRNGDPEDRHYHNLTPASFIDWLEEELARIEEFDRRHAHEKGAIFVGKV